MRSTSTRVAAAPSLPAPAREIVAPEFLAHYRPDVVIVMSPIYLPEIRAQLDNMGVRPQRSSRWRRLSSLLLPEVAIRRAGNALSGARRAGRQSNRPLVGCR